MRRILLIRTDRMGDLLMTLPAVRAMRKAFPEAQITLLMKKELFPLLEHHPDLDRLLPWEGISEGWGTLWRWSRRLHRERFDAAVIFNPAKFFHLAVFLAGIPVRIGYRRKLPWTLTASIPDTKASRLGHESDYNLELVQLLGARESDKAPSLPVGEEARGELDLLLARCGAPAEKPWVALHPWTSNPVKGWSMNRFEEVARGLQQQGVGVLVIGTPEEKAPQPPWRIQGDQIINLTGRLPLKLLPALLARCRLLVSNDSGPVHVAAGVGTPVVVVAPGLHEKNLQRWRPLGEHHRILLDPTAEEVLAEVRSLCGP